MGIGWPRIAANAEGRSLGEPVRQPRVNSGRRIKLGIAECHDERHGASRGETGDIDAPGVNLIIGNHGLRDARDDRGFPFTASSGP